MRKFATLALLGALAIPVTFAASPGAPDQKQTEQKPRKHKKNKKQKNQNPDTEKKEG